VRQTMQTAAEMRERLFTMRMSEEEWRRLALVAEHYGLNGAGAIRMLLKEKEREIGKEAAPRTAKKGTKR
jgi:sulfur relay (sulfurtransferase) DsrC/TusE family protein